MFDENPFERIHFPPRKNSAYGFFRRGIYYPTHDEGFFSILSTMLRDLSRYKFLIRGIDSRFSFSGFGNGAGDLNLWRNFFRRPLAVPHRRSVDLASLQHHSEYSRLKFAEFTPLVGHFFRPSRRVQVIRRRLILRHKISLSSTVFLNFRGTDKGVEVREAPYATYLRLASEKLKDIGREGRVFLMTDQEQFANEAIELFGSRLFLNEQLPRTTGQAVIHKSGLVAEPITFAQNLLANVILGSKCRAAVTHTGNVAFWTALFRGNAEGLTQVFGDDIYER